MKCQGKIVYSHGYATRPCERDAVYTVNGFATCTRHTAKDLRKPENRIEDRRDKANP